MTSFLKALLCAVLMLCAATMFGAVPSYNSFRGTGGILISSNPPTGTIVIDGSGIFTSGTNSTIRLSINGTLLLATATQLNLIMGQDIILTGTASGDSGNITISVDTNRLVTTELLTNYVILLATQSVYVAEFPNDGTVVVQTNVGTGVRTYLIRANTNYLTNFFVSRSLLSNSVISAGLTTNANQFSGVPLSLKRGAFQTNYNGWGTATNQGDFYIGGSLNVLNGDAFIDQNLSVGQNIQSDSLLTYSLVDLLPGSGNLFDVFTLIDPPTGQGIWLPPSGGGGGGGGSFNISQFSAVGGVTNIIANPALTNIGPQQQTTLRETAIQYSHIYFDRVASPISAPTTFTTNVGILNDTYGYAISYVTTNGDTALSAFSTDVPINQMVAIQIPVPTNAMVTARKLWRAGGSLGNADARLVATINHLVATNYIDNATDASLANATRATPSSENTTAGQLWVDGKPVFSVQPGASGEISIGSYAGWTNAMYADANVWIGADAGRYSQFGNGMVAIGTRAAQYMTNSSASVAIGFQAGHFIKDGQFLVLIGQDSMGQISNSVRRVVAIGRDAGWGLQSNANDNVFIGDFAAEATESGSNNVFIGSQTRGSTNTQNAILIGYNASGDGTPGEVVIGSSNAVARYTNFYLGGIRTPGTNGIWIYAPQSWGLDVHGGDLRLVGGRHTGNAVPGKIKFLVSSGGGSGTNVGGLVEAADVYTGGVRTPNSFFGNNLIITNNFIYLPTGVDGDVLTRTTGGAVIWATPTGTGSGIVTNQVLTNAINTGLITNVVNAFTNPIAGMKGLLWKTNSGDVRIKGVNSALNVTITDQNTNLSFAIPAAAPLTNITGYGPGTNNGDFYVNGGSFIVNVTNAIGGSLTIYDDQTNNYFQLKGPPDITANNVWLVPTDATAGVMVSTNIGTGTNKFYSVANGTGMLTNNGSGVYGWMTIPSSGVGTPGGSNTTVQFNNSGSFDGTNAITVKSNTLLLRNIYITNTLSLGFTFMPTNASGEPAGGWLITSNSIVCLVSNVEPSQINFVLPNPAERPGRIVTVKDMKGNFNTAPCQIRAFGGEKIDAVNTYYNMVTPFESKTFISDGANWWVIH